MMDASLEKFTGDAADIEAEAQLDYMTNIDENRFDELDRDFTDYRSYTADTADFYRLRIEWIKNKMR